MLVLIACATAVAVSECQTIHQRLPDAEFFQAFDLSLPALAPVAEAVDAGDHALARERLAAHYRSRRGDCWWFDPHKIDRNVKKGRQCADIAVRAVDRTGEFDESRWLENGELDWLSNATHANWARMYFFQSMGMGYWFAGQEDPQATAWVDLMRSWVKQVTAETGPAYWSTMVVGIRMRTGWPHAFNHFLLSPMFTDDDMVLFLKSTLEQTRYLREKHSQTSNWLTFEMAGLYCSGVLYPELKEAADWRSHAAEIAVTDMDRGYLPDGSSIELSPGYHQFFSNYLTMYDLAVAVGREREDGIDELVAKCEEPYAYYVKLMAPDRTMPAFNDNGPLNVLNPLARAGELFPERADFRWIATDGDEGAPPDDTSLFLPYAGAGAMRSGWERDANCLAFDFGPVGYRHAHQDKLSVVLWAYGRQILFDPGASDYSDTPMVAYCRDTFSHNTVLVDNRPQRRKWYQHPHPERMPYQALEDVRWASSDTFDAIEGEYDAAYGLPGASDSYPYKDGGNFNEGWGAPAIHHRRVVFVKPDLYLVADYLARKDADSHQYDARWHLDSVATEVDGLTVRTIDADLPNVEIVPADLDGLTVRATSAQSEPELLGWKVGKTSEPATTVQHIRQGESVRFVTILAPLKPGVARRVLSATMSGEEATIELADGRTVRVDLPGEPWAAVDVRVDG